MKHYIKLPISTAISLLALISAVHANPATATTDVNVRSGPGGSFAILDQLYRGENVDVVECVQSGWCRVTQDGPSGWVFSRYLGQGNQGNQGGNPANPQPQNQNQGGKSACFYTDPGHRGQSFCIGNGTVNQLPAPFNNNLSSYEVFGGAHVNFCVGSNMTGACYEGSHSTPTLGGPLDNQASSLQVFGGNGGGQNNGGFNNNQGRQQPNQGNQGGNQNQGNQGNPNDPNCSFGLVVDQNGQSSFALTCGNNPVLPQVGNNNQGGNAGNGNGNAGGNQANTPPPLPPVAFSRNEPGACFYSKPNARGQKFCSGIDRIGIFNQAMFENVSSIKLYHGAKVTLCTHTDFQGRCDTFTRAQARLRGGMDNKAQSAVIYVGNDDGISMHRDPQAQAGGNGAVNPPPLPPVAGGNGAVNPPPLPPAAGGNGGAAPRPIEPILQAGVCLYSGESWRGYKRCYGANKEGQVVNLPRGAYSNSIAIAPGVQVNVCTQEYMGGDCGIYRGSSPSLLSSNSGLGLRSLKFLSADRSPPLHAGGTIFLAGGESFDMDRQLRFAPHQGGTSEEFEIGTIPGGNFSIKFNGRVGFASAGPFDRDYIDCAFVDRPVAEAVSVPLSDPIFTKYICITTTDGRIGVLKYKGKRNGKAEFYSKVWRFR